MRIAKAGSITIASRNESALQAVADRIKTIPPDSKVRTSTRGISALAYSLSKENPSGIDCLIYVPASSPPFSPTITRDSPLDNASAFLTNTVGTIHVAKAFIPLLLIKPGVKAFLSVSSLGSTLMRGFAAQPA
jgi:short-subunit dehydrogenase involved in D-alanine esterification of teichoic acids